MSYNKRLLSKLSARSYVALGIILIVLLIILGMFLRPASAATVNLVPSSTVSNAWPAGTAGCITSTTGHTCIDEGSTADVADYVGTGTGVQSVTSNFEMGNQTGVATATSLTLYMNAKSVALLGNAPNADTVTMALTVGGVSAGTAQLKTMTTTFSWYSATFTGNWTQAEVDNMQASFTRTVVGGGNQNNADDNVQIASVYVAMTYTSPVVVTQAGYRWLADDNGSGPSGMFAAQHSAVTGNGPADIIVADFNGDENIDIATANTSGVGASVLIGNGDGTFDPKVDYATGVSPAAITMADFNGDQNLDLIVTNYASSTASVLIGNGDGTFDPKVDYVTGTFPVGVKTGDYNGDQITDIAVANYSGNTVSILIGNGDGTFDPKTDYAAGTNPMDMATGDFNGDQVTDLAVVNPATGVNTASVLIGNGDGTFDSQVGYATAVGPFDITAADFNGDQIVDLVTGNTSSNSTSVLIGNGDGTFDPKVDYATAAGPSEVKTGDFNNDQIVDLVTANASSNTVSLLTGNGDGTFDLKIDSAVVGTTALAVLDFNGDQITDIAVAHGTSSATASVLLGAVVPPTAALAAKDSVATAPSPGVGFRLRLNLAISGETLASSTPFKLRYQQKSGTCSSNPTLYSDVTTSSPIQFFNKPSVASPGGYSVSALDPTRTGVTAISQSYQESSSFMSYAPVSANQDSLWDFSLATADGLTPLTAYCLIATKPDNTALNGYTVIPEISIPNPTLEQSNYRFYQNANGVTPGSPLAAQNTKPTIPVGSDFRLRQLLRQTNEMSSAGTPFKLQAAEKITSCSAGVYATLSTTANSGTPASTGYRMPIVATDMGDGVDGRWTGVLEATAEDGIGTYYVFYDESEPTTPLQATDYGFSIPVQDTITGVEVRYKASYENDMSETGIYLTKDGNSAVGTNMASMDTMSTGVEYVRGSSSNLWGTTLTPSDVNSVTFGARFSATYTGLNQDPPDIEIDYMSMNIHYLTGVTIASFKNNAGPADEATISTHGNDPTATSGIVIPQTYSENETATSRTALQNGENGLWDFSLRADESLIGKTYCFRVAKNDGSSLASYAQYPEVTFIAAGPTLDQQMRGGQSVVNGLKRPFNW